MRDERDYFLPPPPGVSADQETLKATIKRCTFWQWLFAIQYIIFLCIFQWDLRLFSGKREKTYGGKFQVRGIAKGTLFEKTSGGIHMPFWDNLSKKATETTAKAMQKAKDFSDITRLNGQISEEETKINNAFLAIGRLYAEIHSTDAEPQFSAWIASIQESQGKIDTYRRQVQDVKGVQRCEKCGAEVAAGSAFCNSCGAPMPKQTTPVPQGSVICKNCGAIVQAGMKFCTSCGTPVDFGPSSTDNEEERTERVCPSCGAQVQGDSAFCTECGAKL